MNRQDIHSPANFKPEDYVYVTSFDQWPHHDDVDALVERRDGFALLGSDGVHIHHVGDSDENGACGCDHCGARIRYVSIFRHKPTDKVLAVGSTCAEERFGCDSRREYDIKRLKEKAADARERAKAMGAAATFCETNCPELTDWLLTPVAKDVHPIFADMARRLIKFGSLSPKQVDFARKLLRDYYERQRNGGKTDREVQWEAEKAAAPDVPEGRQVVTGTVLKVEEREGEFGVQVKMTVKDVRGFVVWVTVPSTISTVMKGDKVKFTATLTRSDRDAKFGFGKRPSSASIIETKATAEVAPA